MKVSGRQAAMVTGPGKETVLRKRAKIQRASGIL